MSVHCQTDVLFLEKPVLEQPTLLRLRGAVSAVLITVGSLGASLELREELLLENSLLVLLKLEVR